MKLETRRNLGGRKYPRSFFRATMMEGFSRLEKPVNGRKYLKFDGRWGFDKRILGNRNNELVPRLSAAVHRRNRLFKKGTRFLILHPEIYNVFGSSEWRAADTGGGLGMSQIDLYWGEDAPRGPAKDLARPRGTEFAKRWIVPVILLK